MLPRPRTLAVLILLAVIAMVPLYGDPRLSPVTHPEWARMVLRGLELDDALGPSRHASDVFTTLSWRTSLTYPADAYTRAHGVDVHERDGQRLLTVTDPMGGEAAYHMAVVRGGDYRIRLRVSGRTAEQGWAEIAPRGKDGSLGSFGIHIPGEPTWVDAGGVYLDPGTYDASVLLPEGCDLEYVELAPPCVNPIEPIGGWRAPAVAHVYDVAVTTLQALDMEYELPPAETPEEFATARFAVTSALQPIPVAAAAGPVEGEFLHAGRAGVEAIMAFDIPHDGLYSVFAFGEAGAGQTWTADGCQKASICPSENGARWWPVLTNRFEKGRHSLAVRMAAGAVVQRVRVERKKDSPEDYLGALSRLGLELGEPGPVTRRVAADAMDFIQKKRREVWGTLCYEMPLLSPIDPEGTLAVQGAPIQVPGGPPPFSGTPPLPGVGGNPSTPPSGSGFPPGLEPPPVTQPPASPTIP